LGVQGYWRCKDRTRYFHQGRIEELFRNSIDGDQFRKLVQTFGDRPTYTSYQVTAITDPKKKMPIEYIPEETKRQNPPLVDSFPVAEARQQLADYAKAHPEVKKQLTYTPTQEGVTEKGKSITVKNLEEALEYKYGRQPWYLATELRDVEENGIKPLEIPQRRLKGDPVREALDASRREHLGFWYGFKSPRIRQSWRDVLYEDDPSQDSNAGQGSERLGGCNLFVRAR
jgi:hypothetical protein